MRAMLNQINTDILFVVAIELIYTYNPIITLVVYKNSIHLFFLSPFHIINARSQVTFFTVILKNFSLIFYIQFKSYLITLESNMVLLFDYIFFACELYIFLSYYNVLLKITKIFFQICFLFYMHEYFTCMFVYVPCACLLIFVSHCVSAGNQTHILC